MAILQQQLEIQKKIVPDDKDADQFIKLLHDTAATSGIAIRRYTSMPVATMSFTVKCRLRSILTGRTIRS